MAETFAPKFNGEVRFNQPVEAPSMFAGLADVASGIASAFVETKKARDKASEVGGPTYAQEREQSSLIEYTNQLSELQQKYESGGISENQFKISVGRLNTSFAGRGFDVSGSAFDNVRTSITGLPSETMTMTTTQMMINDLQSTPEGQGRIALAQARLVDMGEEVNFENIAAVVQQEEQQKAELGMINVRTEADFAKAEPVLRGTVQNMAANFETSLRLVEQAGIRTDDPELLQNSYLGYVAQRQEIVAKIPLTLPGREEKIKALFGTTDAFFERLGVTEGGRFTQRSKRELDLVREGKLALEMVQADPEKAAMLLESGYADPNFTITPELYTHLSTVLAQDGVDIKTLAPNTPAWIAESGVIITNDMVSVASQLQAIGPDMLRSASELQEAFKSQVGEEVWASWSSRTAEEAWSSTGHYGAMLGGYDAATIRGGQVDTKAVTNNLVGLATSFAVIDLENEPVSFGGVRKAVSSQLPAYVDALEQADPQNGKAARSVLFTSLGMAARQYEAGVTSAEGNLGVTFDPKKRAYNLDTSKIGPDNTEGLWLANIVQKRYGGDIAKALSDNFSRVQESDAIPGFTIGESRAAIKSLTPDPEEILRLLDMRNSVVYLDSLAGQIEPKDFKDARELLGATPNEVTASQVLGAQALEAVATTPRPGDITETTLPEGSTSAALLDRFEGGGDYNALFGFANREGGPFSGVKVSEKTIGELKSFADGEYADYSRNQLGYKATPMGRYQFVGTTLASVAQRMGLSDDTVFTPEVQDQMFVFHAKEVMDGKSPVGKRAALRGTWEGLQNASDAELDQMISEIEGGTASFGSTGVSGGTFRGARPTDANAVASAAPAAAQRAVQNTPATLPTPTPTAAPVASPEAATAALPEEIQRTQPDQLSQQEAARNAAPIDQDVAALIKEIAGSPDKTFETEREFLAAQQRGELEPGDTLVVDGVAYMVRKDGTAKRLGVVQTQDLGVEGGGGNDSLGGGANGDTLAQGVTWDRASGEPFPAREGDTLQEANPTMRDKSFESVQTFLSDLGVDKRTAREYASRLTGDPTTGEVGVADLTPAGAVFMGQEGLKTVQRGIETGDSSTVAQGAVEAGLAALSVLPVVGLIGKGLSKVLKAAPVNNLRTVVRNDDVFRGAGGYKTSLDKATKPYAVRLTGESQIEDMVRSGLVRSKEGGYQGKNIVYYGEMDDVRPTSIFTKPKPTDKQKNYTIVADSAKIAGSSSPATLDDLLHVWTIKDGDLVDVLPELRLLNNMVK